MKFGNVPGVDKPVSRLVHGATAVPQFDEAGVTAAFDAAFEVGFNAFDSAQIYYGGQHERALGKWIAANGIREKVVILAKGAHHNSDRNRVTPFDIAADLHDTLARMKVDYVDMLVLHRDDPAVPVGPIVEALNLHVREGKIKAFGGSNWSHERIGEANAYAREHGLVPFALSNPQLSLATMVKEPWHNCVSVSGPACDEARDWYRKEGLAVFAWSSIAGGFLSGSLNRMNIEEYKSKFGTLAHHWWDPESAMFGPLHQINPLRLDWIDTVTGGLAGKNVLDVGCGGGILSESMAARGATVLGIDLGEKALGVAKLHKLESGTPVEYRLISAEALAVETPARYDVVTCMELLEHVPDPASTVAACATLAKPGGTVVFSTINRNPKAYLFAVIGAEYLLQLLPRGTHDYARFVQPAELAAFARRAGIAPHAIVGMTYNPLSRTYRLAGDTGVNYLMAFRRAVDA